MTQYLEFDFQLKRTPSSIIAKHLDGEAIGHRVQEWLATPMGTVADMPAWGHPLMAFKHEPTSLDLQVMAEMAIFEKLTVDVRDVDIRGVSVELSEIDRIYVEIRCAQVIVSGVARL